MIQQFLVLGIYESNNVETLEPEYVLIVDGKEVNTFTHLSTALIELAGKIDDKVGTK